jgi:hypothetical protein
MKRVFILLMSFTASFVFSQAPVLEPGVYRANAKGQNIMLRVLEDNSYEMAIFHGKYVVTNDTITFLNRDPNSSAFKINVNKEAPFSSSLKIKFNAESLMYGSRNIYIGTQKEDNAVIEYKVLSDFVNKRAYSYSEKKDFKIDVDKVKYLYFVETRYNADATISKFEIDPGSNEIEVEYEGLGMQNFELTGIIDPETKKLSIMEGRKRRDILEFELDKSEAAAVNVKPLTVLAEKDWKKKNGFAEEPEFDSSYLEKRQKTKETFKHTTIKSYADGVKSIAKTPEKFLVVVVDDRKAAKKEFDAFIKNDEERMSGSMYNNYDASKDHFNFYLATDKDKTVVSNFKIKDKPVLVFLNSYGALIYHTAGTIEEKTDLFDSYYSVYEELKRANTHFKVDKLVNAKKATMADFKKTFLDISRSNMASNYNNMAADSTAVETVVEEVVEAAAVVDTAAAVPLGYVNQDYLHVDDPENLYIVKTPKDIIASKWKLIIDFYTKNNTYDEEFIEMCKRELLNTGFMNKLYDGQAMVSETDFKILDYLYKNYPEIIKNEGKAGKAVTSEYGDGDYSDYQNNYNNIDSVLSLFFGRRTDESSHLHRSNQVKLIDYYKIFLKNSGYRLADFANYLERVKETNNNDRMVFLKEYGEFFDNVNSRNSSIIESLDEMYAAQKSGFVNWQDFKRNFALMANNVAWAVVETKNHDPNTIQTAIKWSEASLKIVKNEFHYLDTLAQLYYKNNEKEKGIATEKLAIDNLDPNDKERITEYNEVLQSMKNGTY